MTNYFVIYEDNSTEYIHAYSYERDGERVIFDQGHGMKLICLHVKYVQGE
jgi:hypothetical protein